MILAGDVGGTKTNIGLFERTRGGLRRVRSATYASRDFPGLTPIVRNFTQEPVDAACFGIAGPVIRNRVKTLNLPWELDGDDIGRDLGIDGFLLINDLEATAEGIPALGTGETAPLQEGEPREDGNRALIAAGTGLGMCIVPMTERGHVPLANEGGHASFAAQTDEEIDLLRFLMKRFPGHVSRERVLSGPGLRNVYDFLVEVRGMTPERAIAERMESEDPSRVIGSAGVAGSSEICVKALDIFLAAYGSAAGNLALSTIATGGLFVGGGIAPKLMPKLADGTFREAFCRKGRFTEFLERIPVRVILNPEAALLGAARRAALIRGGGAR